MGMANNRYENRDGHPSYLLHTKINSIYFTILLVIIVAIVVGQYHIVSGVPGIFVKRPYVGFSDIYGSIEECTDVPYIVAVNHHQSLCTALLNEGYIEKPQ